jgi:hypothetical protein
MKVSANFVVTNTILTIGDEIAFEPERGKRDIIVPAYRFENAAEQAEVISVMIEALHSFDGMNEHPKPGVVAACLSEQARHQIGFGRLLRK